MQALQTLNAEVLGRLAADGVDIDHTIYVALDSAGSSSGVMLNLLRDHANLERRGARFIHSRDVTGLQELTRSLERGALVYVDDFAGTGKQFLRNRRHAAAYLAGTFSEFFIGVCICDEARQRMEEAGVVPVASVVHSRANRPLHGAAKLLSEATRAGLLALSRQAYPPKGLGFDELATSVVLYRNAPNTTPLLLRGNLGQHPLRGIVPRFDDM